MQTGKPKDQSVGKPEAHSGKQSDSHRHLAEWLRARVNPRVPAADNWHKKKVKPWASSEEEQEEPRGGSSFHAPQDALAAFLLQRGFMV